jgi:kinesin family protein 11
MKDVATQMQALDDFVTRARSQNAQHHDNHVASLQGLSTTVKSSYSSIGSHFNSTYERVRDLGEDMSKEAGTLEGSLDPLDSHLSKPLADLREQISRTALQEYQPTGETPQKVQYSYPTDLPRTMAHETLLAALRRPTSTSPSQVSETTMIPVIFNDSPIEGVTSPSGFRRTASGLREVDVNINAGSLNTELAQSLSSSISRPLTSAGPLPQIPSFKRSTSGKGLQKGGKKSMPSIALEGRENAPLQAVFSQSVGRRRSPRTG